MVEKTTWKSITDTIYKYLFGWIEEDECMPIPTFYDIIQMERDENGRCVPVTHRFTDPILKETFRIVTKPVLLAGKLVFNGINTGFNSVCNIAFELTSNLINYFGLDASSYGLLTFLGAKITFALDGLLNPVPGLTYPLIRTLLELFLLVVNLYFFIGTVTTVFIENSMTSSEKLIFVGCASAITIVKGLSLPLIQDYLAVPSHLRLRGGSQKLLTAALPKHAKPISKIICIDLDSNSKNPITSFITSSEIVKKLIFDFHATTRFLN